ncbi:MAG: hypothetical protein KDD84_14070, partial [Caldilineaceae bacterium]|nr:hypothetical protein [Caldilineaceae bacterium]
LIRSPWFWVILSGYLLRILLMPVTGQHDVMFMPWMTQYINQGHFNLYAYLHEQYGDVIMQRPGVWAPYPYGFYLLTAGWLAVLDKLGAVDVNAWPAVWSVSHPARAVFMLKLLYLPFDFAIGYFLLKASGRLGAALWAWSPLAIYTPFMMGQNDIYATAFAVAGVYVAAKGLGASGQDQRTGGWMPTRWAMWSVILLGLGSVFKIYPLLLLPPLVLIVERRWWQRFLLLGLGCSLPGLASLPFLGTPTYINGVLFNHEGTQIFREIQLFGTNVAPFLLSYLILLVTLALTDSDRAWAAHLPWISALVVLASLFLWIPAPLYWLIWLTPFVVGAHGQGKNVLLLTAWASLQIGFGLALTNEHRELGVALPTHLSGAFNAPNLATTLAVAHPTLGQIYTTLLPAVRTLLMFSLLLMLWSAIRGVTHTRRGQPQIETPQWWILAPTAVLLLMLTTNLLLAGKLISYNNWYQWQPLTIQQGDQLVQEVLAGQGEISGVRLRLSHAGPPVNLEICVFDGEDMAHAPVACATQNTAAAVENQMLHVLFDRVTPLTGTTALARVQLLDPGATLTVPFGESTRRIFQQNDSRINGSLDISALTPFSISAAFGQLIVDNILADPRLIFAIVLSTLLVVLFWSVVLSPQEYAADG